MPDLHLVCFAAGDTVHTANQQTLIRSARRHGIDNIHVFSERDYDPSFFLSHSATLNHPTGAGYWLWKPYFIAQALERIADNDIVLYVDSGAYLRCSPRFLVEQNDADFILFANDYLNRIWVKRDAFLITGTDTDAYHDAHQLDAALLIIRNRPNARTFIQNWLAICCDPQAISNDPSLMADELPGFREHRHDQALLSLLYWRDKENLSTILHPRCIKYLLLNHHRRRSDGVPIWLWHLFHDAFFSIKRRIKAHAHLRQTQQ